jgi:hypothetical protein
MIDKDFKILLPFFDKEKNYQTFIDELLVGKCFEDIGYILSVVKFNIKEIKKISSYTNNTEVIISSKINVFKPEINTILKCKIISLLDKNNGIGGARAEYHNNIPIFINKNYENYKIGSVVDVKINEVKFNNGKFFSICEIIK